MSVAQRKRKARRAPAEVKAAPERGSGLWWRAAVIAAAGLLTYLNALNGPMIFDDRLTILENGSIRQLWNVSSVLQPEREMPTAGRPLVNVTFAINYALGNLDVFGYHLVNLALHLMCALLLFSVIRRTLLSPGLKARFGGTALNLGFAVALLWTLHPLNSETVNYLTQRTELMMGLFYLLTLYASIRAWQSRQTVWTATAIVACAAGMACKESMATAPVTIVLYDSVFVFHSITCALRERGRFYAALCASWLLLAVFMWSGPRIHSAGFSTAISPLTYLLNQTEMITHYLVLAAWPRSLVLNYGWPVPLTLSDVLPYALLISALLAATIVALVRWPMWGFLGAWFFITLAPTSSIVPIATEVGAERRMYLPLIALIVLAVLAVSMIKRATSTAGAVALTVVAVLLSAATFARNREYQSELVLAETVVARRPTPFGHHMLAAHLLEAGQRDRAMAELRQAIPGDPRAHYSLGAELLKEGKTDEGIAELRTFLREQPMLLEAVSARLSLGQGLVRQRRWPDVLEQANMVLTMNPTEAQRVDAHGLLGLAYFGMMQYEQAILHDREYVRARPKDPAMLSQLGSALIATGVLEEAIPVFREAVEVAPKSADAHRNLANALYDHRDVPEAAVHAQQAVTLRPDDADAHDLLGRTLAILGRYDEARSHFERALQINPAHPDAADDLQKLAILMKRQP